MSSENRGGAPSAATLKAPAAGLADPATPPTLATTGQLLDVRAAADILGTPERFLRTLIFQRRINYVKIGKYVRIERGELQRLIDAGRVPAVR